MIQYSIISEIAFVFFALFNCFISIKVLMDSGLTTIQKFLQILIAWIFPIVGGIVVILVHWEDEKRPTGPTRHRDSDNGHDSFPGGIQ